MNLMRFRAVAWATMLLSVAACGDAPTEPTALLVAEHARAALEVAVPLPSLEGTAAMSRSDLEAVMHDLGVWLDAADARVAASDGEPERLEHLRLEIAAARELLAEAARREAAGDRAAAVAALANARAGLQRTTTAAVAEQRIDAAALAEARCDPVGPEAVESGPHLTLERARRLLAHAREALSDGDAERALQRAHYAAAMLERACPAAATAGTR